MASAASAAPVAPVLGRWGATMGGSQVVSAAQAVADAQSVDMLVGLSGTFGPFTAQMRAANPALRLVYYLNGVYANGATQDSYPESWYLHDALGQRVRSTNFGNPLMDPTNAEWIQSRVSDCATTVATLGWDGCYLDMLGAGTLTPSYLTSQPLNPVSGTAFTNTEWVTDTTNLAATVSAALPGMYLVGNGVGAGVQYFSSSWGPSSMLIGPLAAGNAQGFVRGDQDPPTVYRRESSWRTDVDMLVDSSRRAKSVMVEAKVWAGGVTQAQKDSIHRYALATFLLGTDGRQQWYWSDTGQESAVVEDSAYEHVNIGTPIESYAKMLGVYQRRYSGGLVMVNPTPAAVTVALPAGSWTTLTGTVVQGQITLAANTGDALTTTRPWGPAPTVTAGVTSNITPTSATLSAVVNPAGLATTARAEYGTDNTLGTLTAAVTAGSGTAGTAVQFNLSGLKAGTTYTYHVDATNADATAAGADVSFTTPLPAPTVRTSSAVLSGVLGALVAGYVKPNGLPTTYHIDYGPTTAYTNTSPDYAAGSGTTLLPVNVLLSGLSLGVMHYRIEATNATGTSYGLDRTIKIL